MTEKQKPRDRILETAHRLFHSQGFNSTGINQVVKEAGVAKASLYEHFQSKENLAIAYLNARHTAWFGGLRDRVSAYSKELEKLMACFDFIEYMNEKENFRGCCFLNMLSEISAEHKEIQRIIRDHKSDLREYIEGLLNVENRQHTDHVYMLFESAMIESQLYRDNWPVQKAKSIVKQLIK